METAEVQIGDLKAGDLADLDGAWRPVDSVEITEDSATIKSGRKKFSFPRDSRVRTIDEFDEITHAETMLAKQEELVSRSTESLREAELVIEDLEAEAAEAREKGTSPESEIDKDLTVKSYMPVKVAEKRREDLELHKRELETQKKRVESLRKKRG